MTGGAGKGKRDERDDPPDKEKGGKVREGLLAFLWEILAEAVLWLLGWLFRILLKWSM